MADLIPICRALELVETGLTAEIGVADMARAAGFSLYHFCRMFNAATHHPPYDYLMRRRLAEAAREVLTTRRRVLDIALDYQFNNPETFSRAFKRILGRQPSELRREGAIDPRRLMPQLTPAHLAQIARGGYTGAVAGAGKELRLAGISTLLKDERDVAELWDLLRSEAGHMHGTRYGVSFYSPGWERRGIVYLAAIETGQEAPLPGALARKDLALPTYTRLVHRGSRQTLGLSLDYVFHTWLARAGLPPTPPWIVEEYGASLLQPDDTEAEIGLLIPT